MTLQHTQQNTSNHSLSHRNLSVFVQQHSRSSVLLFKAKHSEWGGVGEEIQSSTEKDHMVRVWYSQFG